MINYHLQHGLDHELVAQAVEIYDQAFGPKTRFLIPNAPVRRDFLQKVMNPALCITAIEGGTLLGLAGYQTAGSSFSGGMLGRGMSLATACRLLPPRAALRAWFVSQIFERRPKGGELVLDGIAVSSASRGRGIGGAMLGELISFAASSGYSVVTLNVIDTNPRARALYERLGFKPVKVNKFEFLRGILGFGSATTMSIRARLHS